MNLSPGQPVRIIAANPRLHGTAATVEAVTEWGYLLSAPAAATGRFRALPDEVEALTRPSLRPVRKAVQDARDAGYTGDECPTCGAMKMRRNGSCLVCDGCGSTSGCS